MNKLTPEQYIAARQMIDVEIIGALDQHKGKILDSWYDKLASILQFHDPDAPTSTGRALIGESMTVAELIGHLKTLPQHYIVKSGTVNGLADEDVKPDFVTANHERKVVVI